jgi:hypothetical protein
LVSVWKIHLGDPKPIEFCSKHPEKTDHNKGKKALEESKACEEKNERLRSLVLMQDRVQATEEAEGASTSL